MHARLSVLAARIRGFITQCGAAHGDCDAAFNRLALDLFHFQFDQVEPYRRWCERRRCDPGRTEHWTGIPAIPVEAFKEFEVTSLAPGERSKVFHSSGTTGQRPSLHYHDPTSLALYEHSLTSWFKPHLEVPPCPTRVLSLTPEPSAAPRSSLVHMIGTVASWNAETVYAGRPDSTGGWHLDFPALVESLERFEADGQPVMIVGTAFSFVHLVDGLRARSRRFSLPPGSRVMETGGYKGRSREIPQEDLHGGIAHSLGIPPDWIVTEYGMSELGSQGYSHVAGGPTTRTGHRFPPWTRLQAISPETAKPVPAEIPGLVRILDLANVASVLAVQTSDLGVVHGQKVMLLGRAAKAEPRGCSLLQS